MRVEDYCRDTANRQDVYSIRSSIEITEEVKTFSACSESTKVEALQALMTRIQSEVVSATQVLRSELTDEMKNMCANSTATKDETS